MVQRERIVNKNGGGQLGRSEGYLESAQYQVMLFEEGFSPVAVVSAMSGVTDQLIRAEHPKDPGADFIKALRNDLEALFFPILEKNLGSENRKEAKEELKTELDDLCALLENGTEADQWKIHAKGERVSALMLKYHIRESGYDAVWFDGYDLISATSFGTIREETYYRTIPDALEGHLNPRLKRIPVVCGFGAKEADTGKYITLGRNASDYSGAAVAKAVRAIRYEIIKEEPTIFRVDPKLLRRFSGTETSREFEEKFKLHRLSYNEGVELTSKGSEVVHPMAIDLCERNRIPIHVKNLQEPQDCTIIGKYSDTSFGSPVAAVHAGYVPILTVVDRKMSTPEGRGYESIIANILAEQAIDIYNITDSSTTVSHVISKDESNGVPIKEILERRLRDYGLTPSKVVHDIIGYLCVVGDSMRERTGTTAAITNLLKNRNISLRTFGQCDEYADTPVLNIGVSKDDLEPAVRAFCEEGIFFEDFWK